MWEAIQPAKTISRGKYLKQLYWMKVRSWEFYLAAFSVVGEADVYQTEKWILCQFVGENGERCGPQESQTRSFYSRPKAFM